MSDDTRCWAIIPAAGIGERIGAEIPKQYIQIANKTILEHALLPFLNNDKIEGVAVALNANDEHFENLNFDTKKKIITVTGGRTRAHSVFNALLAIKDKLNANDFVLIHDAARPCLSDNDLNKLIDATMQHDIGSILAGSIADTVKRVEGKIIIETLDRSKLWRAYTPQMFRYQLLLDALKKCIDENIPITDEANAIETIGFKPEIVQGDPSNIKVTTPEDLKVAERYLNIQ